MDYISLAGAACLTELIAAQTATFSALVAALRAGTPADKRVVAYLQEREELTSPNDPEDVAAAVAAAPGAVADKYEALLRRQGAFAAICLKAAPTPTPTPKPTPKPTPGGPSRAEVAAVLAAQVALLGDKAPACKATLGTLAGLALV